MQVSNILNKHGRPAVNQFSIRMDNGDYIFQSYRSIVAKITNAYNKKCEVILDRETWDYSDITRKYRNIFLGEDSKTVKEKVRLGIYKLDDLNK